jgi:transposase-like protein
MASRPQSIKHCPVCGVAMLASKSNPDSRDFDTFTCLKCEAVINLTPARPRPKVGGAGSE